MSELQTTIIKHPSSEKDNITLNPDGSIGVGASVVGPGTILFANQQGKLPYQADKVIIAATDPDPAQGDQNWIWFKV
jgi:hypothetical protein